MKKKKNKEYEESQIATIHIFGFELYFTRKHNLKKSCLYHQILFLCVAGYLKHNNDTPKLNIHKYTNCNIIEIYINRLSATTQIFIAFDDLIMMAEKYIYLRKKKCFGKDIFSHPVDVTGSMYSRNIFRIMCYLKICTKTCKQFE